MNKNIVYKNSKVHYQSIGNGPAVVLIHGFGEDHKIWDGQVPSLSPYQLIVPDLPGTGLSEMIPDMSMVGIADSILSILDHEHIETCVMLGHSMGGYITLAVAEKHPERLNGFGLVHSTAYADTKEKVETREKGIRFINEYGGFAFLKNTIPNLYGPETKEKHPDKIDEHIISMQQISDAALIAYYESMIKRSDRTTILKNTSLPVFFAFGTFDNAVPLKDGLEQCHLPDLSFTNIFENAGHMGTIEAAEEMSLKILDYLSFIYQS
jgi:pimeloyl-ACP methyl ester carboxylesterase